MDKSKENSEEKILSAAEDVFMHKGYDGARMQKIADKAGINKALLHYYFRSKEKLFDHVIKRKINSFLPHATDIFQSDKPLIDRIELFVDDYLDLLSHNQRLPFFMINTINKYPNLVKLLPHNVLESITREFSKAVAIGEIKEVKVDHFIVTLISMCIFPILGKPIMHHVLDKTDDEYQTFIQERKKEVKQYVRSILTP